MLEDLSGHADGCKQKCIGENSEFEKFQSRCKNWQLFCRPDPHFEKVTSILYILIVPLVQRSDDLRVGNNVSSSRKRFPGILCTCWISNFPTIAEGFCIF